MATGEKGTARRGRSRKNATQVVGGTEGISGVEEKLWLTADELRNNIDAAEDEPVIGLIFLNCFSDAFLEKQDVLEENLGGT
jgi:type I restriction-modification system DNA methylase subunit